MIASVDVANGYNEIKRSSILQAVWDCPDLRGSYFFFCRILSQSSYIGLGSGAHVINAPFTCGEEVQQGAVEASFLFCAVTNKANQATHHELLESNSGLAAGMDDTYLMGHPDATVPAVSNHKT
eukprot:12771443-Ditylum_brightwellii.AAC.1